MATRTRFQGMKAMGTLSIARIRSAWWALLYMSVDGPCRLSDSRRVIGSILAAPTSVDVLFVDVPVAGGVVRLDALHWPDWRVFRGVFAEETYKTDFENSVVIDVGAHRGIFSAYVLQHGCSVLLAYEPETTNFGVLQQNIALSRRRSQMAAAHKKAVGRTGGLVDFYVYDEGWSHSTSLRSDKKLVRRTSAESVSLDDVIDEAIAHNQREERVILKLDVEGSEFDIVEAASRRSLRYVDELFVETHGDAGDRLASLDGALRAAGLCAVKNYARNVGPHRLHRYVRGDASVLDELL